MKGITFGAVVIAACTLCAGSSSDKVSDIRLKGPYGVRLDKMIANHVTATDTEYITAPFREKTERRQWWQTEFWGKYMHSAAPFWTYTHNAQLEQNIEYGLKQILASQEECGYIGNYPDELRCGEGWDVWGMKYTMMGLIHYYDAFKSVKPDNANKALEACKRLCNYVIDQIGPNGKRGIPFAATGNCASQPSCSMLEPVMWLYDRTKDKKYLDFGSYIVEQIDDPKVGPELIRLADVPVYMRQDPSTNGVVWADVKHNRLKSYEMMSCYQGLLEYYQATGRKDCLDAAVKAANSIIRDEINLAGGCTSEEHWYHGSVKQHKPYVRLQETCVTITWMRLCEKLLEVTGDAKWADQFERTFHNIYLGAMRTDGGEFAAYIPLTGYKWHCHDHCYMHTDCCNANGPRGYLAYLRSLYSVKGNEATINYYASANFSGMLENGKKAAFEMYTTYPNIGKVRIASHSEGEFTLKLRIPEWSGKTRIVLNNKELPNVKAGAYFPIDRNWQLGDVIEVEFEMSVIAHVLDNFVAFTRGPVLLARDSRFGDGNIAEELRRRSIVDGQKMTCFEQVHSPGDEIIVALTATLPIGSHIEHPEGKHGRTVNFCDYASAGNEWRPSNYFRTWFEMEIYPQD